MTQMENRDENDDTDKLMWNLTQLCESDPDSGLGLIKEMIKNNNEMATFNFLNICKMIAYRKKGLLPLMERTWFDIREASPQDFRLYLNDENLNSLEFALSEIRNAIDLDPSFMKTNWELIENHFDTTAFVLERCRPGRVQQILTFTKLKYFGIDRIKPIPHLTDEEKIPSGELSKYLNIFFSHPNLIKSALILETGKDIKNRKYLEFMLFNKPFSDFSQGETFGDANIGEIFLLDDGSFSLSIEKMDVKQPENSKKQGLFNKLFK